MRKGIGLVLCFIVVIIAGVAFVPQSAGACSCAAPPPLSEDLERNVAVFSGKVLEITEPPARKVRSSADPVKVLIEVKDVWKGVDTSQVIVQTAMSSASCGYPGFAVGGEYLIFAGGESDHLRTGLCSRTAPLSASADVVAQLGESHAPTKLVELREEPDGGNMGWWVAAAGVVLAGAAVVGIRLAIRQKRR